jgi:hypothetical protein
MKKVLAAGILFLCAAMWVLPAPATAGYKAGGGYLEVKVDGALKLKPLRVVWVWEPFFDDPFSLQVFARCVREDQAGDETGKNKVLFKNLRISSLDTSKIAVFKTVKAKMKAGSTGWKSWNAGFMEPLHADGPALASLDIQIKGKIKGGDRVKCYVDVNEGVFGFTKASSADAGRAVEGPAGTGRLLDESGRSPETLGSE